MSKSKNSKAVALRYKLDEDVAPVVIASGYGTIAEKIIDIAEQRGIPVFRDDSAASMMCMLEVGKDIPVELYEIVAAVYAQILHVSRDIKEKEHAQEQPTLTGRQRRENLTQRIRQMTQNDDNK